MDVIAAQEKGPSSLAMLDRVGACVSAACALHCLLMPVVITFLPLIGIGFLAEGTFESVMIGVALAIASLSLAWGIRVHGRRDLILLIPAAALLFGYGHLFSGDAHWVLMALGGCALAIGHFVNRRLCKTCPDCRGH